MTEATSEKQSTLAGVINKFAPREGVGETNIPSLFFIHHTSTYGPVRGVYKPSVCIIVQGEKEILLGQDRLLYGPKHYLVASVDLPVSGQILEASASAPYLAMKLEFTPAEILKVMEEAAIQIVSGEDPKRGMYVNEIEAPILDVAVRLASLLEKPEDIPVLAPLVKKEILYRLLQGKHGSALAQMAVQGSYTQRIRDVIDHIRNHYDQSFRIEELAEIAGMSVSTLHRHFREVTAMSPIQFQKQIRLQEARHLLLYDDADTTDAALQVGYESVSQFSREYARMFGFPPRRDINRLKEDWM
ncbi:AraC family transcriptional regulator [Terribacillus saccharophilus]|uniref:AraC family transcriptional regulator n=1 Tax=Terribacillus saccharophilus TaxID=361277 RepID=A0A268H9X1_9BACI|nr:MULTISPECIES: AraC family transcriptional regulator [Terribacillus]PAE06644.1 AraC family transcriptional regulator [Terribacillus saccharophilus]VVM34710.1 Transcriptional regulator2C AraC family [Terribacillus sp. AE2B 122]